MKASELIEILRNVRPDTDVIFHDNSDFQPIEEVQLITAEESSRLVREHHEMPDPKSFTVHDAVCFRKGRFCHAYALKNYPHGEVPIYHDVLVIR